MQQVSTLALQAQLELLTTVVGAIWRELSPEAGHRVREVLEHALAAEPPSSDVVDAATATQLAMLLQRSAPESHAHAARPGRLCSVITAFGLPDRGRFAVHDDQSHGACALGLNGHKPV